jgi:AraC-like DNA-binding protein
MAETSPFELENQLEDEIDEELLLLLASAFLYGTSIINPAQDSRDVFQTVQERFRRRSSEILPLLYRQSQEAVKSGLSRTMSELGLVDLSVDLSDPRFQRYIERIFDDNIQVIMDTNQQMWIRLQQIAAERGWSDEELLRRLERYYGLTPNHLQTVLSMESNLQAEGVSGASFDRQIQNRIDRLIEWRIRLTSALIGTEVIEGSKDLSFTILGETDQLDREAFQKQWVSVVDSETTDVCLSSNLTVAEIGGNFANGRPHPPAFPPLHPCRSSMRIVRRRL